MNNMKSYILTFLLDRPLLKNVVQIHGKGKTRCFYENLRKKCGLYSKSYNIF